MKIEQGFRTKEKEWSISGDIHLGKAAQFVLVFGSSTLLKETKYIEEIRNIYPSAILFGCSTAGEILNTQVFDDTLTMTAVQLEHSSVKATQVSIADIENSYKAGEYLVKALQHDDLVHVFVLSDGLRINGSELVEGITNNLPKKVSVTGGLSGDGDSFQETYVLSAGDVARKDIVAALGFYGERLEIGYGSFGGWDPFGPERLITKSKANVLYEFDGKSALELYKKYLGDHAQGLPATGLLFPLSVRMEEDGEPIVRTLLSINEAEKSMTFAGNLPENAYARLMKANLDRLIDGAIEAADMTLKTTNSISPDLAILISCVGRKLILKQRVEEEIEGVSDVLGNSTILTGFYSYGEISPFTKDGKCELHNQTMTITSFTEK